jgi:hypothetical protein
MLFLTGSGPGTFNSRASFLLNGDYAKSKFLENILGVHTPKYAVIGVYPLWNTELAQASTFMHGTRNQPFSSIIALLAEYGFVFVFLLALFVFKKQTRLVRNITSFLNHETDDLQGARLLTMLKLLKFSSLFLAILLFTDNYFEYPEIIFLFVMIYKLIELEYKTSLDERERNQ